jgi:hypothetical protein
MKAALLFAIACSTAVCSAENSFVSLFNSSELVMNVTKTLTDASEGRDLVADKIRGRARIFKGVTPANRRCEIQILRFSGQHEYLQIDAKFFDKNGNTAATELVALITGPAAPQKSMMSTKIDENSAWITNAIAETSKGMKMVEMHLQVGEDGMPTFAGVVAKIAGEVVLNEACVLK